MTELTIAGTDYSCFDQWGEMPLSKATELATLCNKEMPFPLKNLYTVYAKSKGAEDEETKKDIAEFAKDVTDEDTIKNFPVFYGKIIKCLSDIPNEIINKIDAGNRVAFYQQYCFKFVFGVLHFPFDFVAKGITEFTHHDITYYCPKSKTVLGEVKPFADRTAIEFAEAADLELFSNKLDGGKFECAANIIAVLCRPMVEISMSKAKEKYNGQTIKQIRKHTKEDYLKLEPYNEDTCLKRAETFHDLPMNIVWEVFFCLVQQSILLNQNIAISSLEAGLKALRQEITAV